MSNSMDFLLVISKIKSPIYCRSPQLEQPNRPSVVFWGIHSSRASLGQIIIGKRPFPTFF